MTFLASVYEGPADSWRAFDTEADAVEWHAANGGVVWQAHISEREQILGYPARIEEQRQIGLEWVREYAESVRKELGL